MYQGKKILAFVPARLGSQGVPCKNMRVIQGLPLFMHSVKYAFSSKYVDDVLVSSDSRGILNLAHARGCLDNDLRPAELSNNTARIIDCMLWELSQQQQSYDAIILLQPTYPIRPPEMIDKAIEMYFEKETSLISVVKCHEQPEFIRSVDSAGELCKILGATADIRRQEFPSYYKIAGSIYINNVHTLTKNVVLNENKIPYLMEDYYGLDIDTELDWAELEKRCEESQKQSEKEQKYV